MFRIRKAVIESSFGRSAANDWSATGKESTSIISGVDPLAGERGRVWGERRVAGGEGCFGRAENPWGSVCQGEKVYSGRRATGARSDASRTASMNAVSFDSSS